MGRFREKTREARLKWFGHVVRNAEGPKRGIYGCLREDMAVSG